MAIIKHVGPNRKLHLEFDSVHQVFRAIDKFGWTPGQDEQSATPGTAGGFYTFPALTTARNIFENEPWKVRVYDENKDRLESPSTPGKEVVFDVTGDYIDIGRAVEGDPESFGSVTMGNPTGAFCTINILDIYVYSTNSKFLLERQKRILRLVDWLEDQGVRCQIVASGDSKVMYMSTVVKRFQDPMDMNTLAVVSHPDWLRRIKFLLMEQSPTWEYGYGSALDYDQRMMDYEPTPDDGLYVYCGGYLSSDKKKMTKQFDSVEQKIGEWVREGLKFNPERLTIG